MVASWSILEHKRDCPYCNKTIIYPFLSAKLQAEERSSGCKSCRSVRNNKSPKRNNKLDKNSQWKGYKGVPFSWFSSYFLRKDSRKKRRSGSITIEDVYNKLEQQKFTCALTGIPLAWDLKSGMSIDRINSELNYDLDNIQIVHKHINIMKNKYDQKYFIDMCMKVTKHHENRI